jgi:hypothetical protein
VSSTTTADKLLAELLERRGAPVATVVVAAPGFEGDVQSRLDIRAKEVRRHLEDAGLPASVVDRVTDEIQGQVGEDGLGLGVVADAHGIVSTSLLDVDEEMPVLQVAALPRWVPFLRERFENRPHLVVRCDRIGAQIARVERGEIQRDTEVVGDDENVQKVHAGGWSQRRFQNRAEHTWDQNAKEIAENIVEEADAIDAELLVVTGDVRAVQLVAEHLPERLQDQLVLDDRQPFDDESDAAVFDRAMTLVRDRAGRDIVAVLERFGELRGQGQGTADDISDVFAALRQGAVDTLLVKGDSGDPAHVALDDPMQVALSAPELTDLGFEEVAEARLTDAAVGAALAGGSQVVIVPEHGPNTPSGALGAILRF